MSSIVKAETIFTKIQDLERRLSSLENQLRSAVATHKVGAIIFTPQSDSYFTDTENQVKGNVAVKDSDNKIYLYNGSAWVALH